MSYLYKVGEHYVLDVQATKAKIYNHHTGKVEEELHSNCYHTYEDMATTALRKWRELEGIPVYDESEHNEFFVDGRRIVVER